MTAASTKTKASTKADHASATKAAPVVLAQKPAKAPQGRGTKPPKGQVAKDDEEFEKSIAESIANAVVVQPGSSPWGIKLYRDLYLRVLRDIIVVGEDKRWARARENAGFPDLYGAAFLVMRVLAKLAAGLEMANEGVLRGFHQTVLQDYVQTAKAVVKRLRDLDRSPSKECPPRLSKLSRKMFMARTVLECAEAWQEALPLVVHAAKRRPVAETKDVVETVVADNPELRKRLRLAEAVENATAESRDVFDIVRSCWGKGEGLTREPLRDVAYKLTALACGVDSADGVRHMCNFARAERNARSTSARA